MSYQHPDKTNAVNRPGTGPTAPENEAALRLGGTGLGTASLVLGLCSIVGGWLLVAPIIGLVLGIKSRRREPMARTRALWGIALNAFCLLTWLVLAALLLVGLIAGGC